MAAVDDVDFTAAEALRALHGILGKQGIRLLFCELVDDVEQEFERSHLTELFSAHAFFPTPVAVLTAFRGTTAGETAGE
jgi:anti-anti-sigma regulatory factor